MWDLSCLDWETRIRQGQSLIPALPLYESEASNGLKVFDALQLPDVPGLPKMGDVAGQWYKDIVRTVFGSFDPSVGERHIRDIFCLAPKGSSKTTYSAGLMLAMMVMNIRPRAEMLFVGPTQAVSDRAYEQAAGMVEASPVLKGRFRTRDHIKTITDLHNHAEMKVKTFDLSILTGSILIFCLLDEIHLLGRSQHTAKVLRQIRGGLDKTAEGLLLITTTQSDDIPVGSFKDELYLARRIRDGEYRNKLHRPMLPVLYEFPRDIATNQDKWGDPANWPMVQPNLGRSVHMNTLTADWATEKDKGDQSKRIWASQHLNIEMGLGLLTDGWPGAEFWAGAVDDSLSLNSMLERCEVIIVGIDGGGLDDLFGLALLGREKTTRRWLAWSHAWCHEGVLERRKSIARQLQDFADAGELTIVDDKLEDVGEIVEVVDRVNKAGSLVCVAIDNEGPYGVFIDALSAVGVTEPGGQVIGVGQGYKLMSAIKTTERKLANGTLVHSKSAMMDWCVRNVRLEATATAIRATKQNAGDAKIDPWCALMDAAFVMVRNPDVGRSVYDDIAEREGKEPDAVEAVDLSPDDEISILRDPTHPRFPEMRDKLNERLAMQEDAGGYF